MSRTTFIILTIAVLILGSAGLYFILGGKSPIVNDVIDGLPFGDTPSGDIGGTTGGQDSGSTGGTSGGTGGTTGSLNHFFKISSAPISGAVGFSKNGTTFVRYVDRATGHVFDVNPATLEKIQVLNTTEPNIYKALWKNDASGFVARSIEDGSDTVTNTSIALIVKSTSTPSYTAQATLLRGNLADIAMNVDGAILYVLKDTGAVSTASFIGDRPRTLYQSPFTNWRIVPASASTALLYTKASSEIPGYAYTLSITSGGLTKVLGPITSLTAVPSTDARRVVYGGLEGGSVLFAMYNIANKTSTSLFPATFPEKCVWAKKNTAIFFCGVPKQSLGNVTLDSWYKGLLHFSDQIWKFDATSGTADLLIDPESAYSAKIDAIDPVLSPNEDYLFVTNKNDLSLWALKLN